MKKRINIKIDNGFIITVKGLKKMHNFLIDNYKELKVKGTIINGEDIYFDSFEELINYDNYNDNKIIKIQLFYENSFEDSFEIGFSVDYLSSLFSNSYTIVSNDLDKFNKVKNKIKKIIKNEFKQWYSFLNIDIIYAIINYIILLLLLNYIILLLRIEIKGSLNLISIMLFPIIIIFYPFYHKIWGLLFPKGIFAIGKQKEKIEFHKKIREIVFIVILLGVGISIIANYIFAKIS